RRGENQGACPRLEELAGRRADVESLDADRLPLAPEERVGQRGAQRACLVDLGAAEDAFVPGRQRLRDRRGRPQDVDDDADCRRMGLARRESDVDGPPTTLLRTWTQPARRPVTATRTAP